MTRQKHAVFCKRVPVFVHIDVSSLWLSWSYPPLIFLPLSICIISFLFLAVYLLLVDFLWMKTGRTGLEPISTVLETVMLPITPPTYRVTDGTWTRKWRNHNPLLYHLSHSHNLPSRIRTPIIWIRNPLHDPIILREDTTTDGSRTHDPPRMKRMICRWATMECWREESNLGPSAYQAGALPTELRQQNAYTGSWTRLSAVTGRRSNR